MKRNNRNNHDRRKNKINKTSRFSNFNVSDESKQDDNQQRNTRSNTRFNQNRDNQQRNTRSGTRFNQNRDNHQRNTRSGTRFNQNTENNFKKNLKTRGNNSLEDHLNNEKKNTEKRDGRRNNRRDRRDGRRDGRRDRRRDGRRDGRRRNNRNYKNKNEEELKELKKPIFNMDVKSDELFPSLNNNELENNCSKVSSNWNQVSNIKKITQEQINLIEKDKKIKLKQKNKEIALKLQKEKEQQQEKEKEKLIYEIETSKNNYFLKEKLLEELQESDNESDFEDDLMETSSVCSVDSFYDPDNEDPFWDYEYWPMKNPEYNYQCIYEQDNYGEIYKKWVGIREVPKYDNTEDKYTHMQPEDFGNYHPDDDNYVDPRIDALYAKYGEDIKIGFNKVIHLTVFRSRFRPVYPIFPQNNDESNNVKDEYKPNWINLTERFNKRLAEGKIFTYGP